MQSPFSNITPVVKNLLIINIICFIPTVFFTHGDFDHVADPVAAHFGVYYFNSPNFKPWQILTYMFVHGNWMHIFFNMFALFSFGPIVEYSVGSKKFFNLYFICGIGAALFQMVVQGIEVHHILNSFTLAGTNQLQVDPITYEKLHAIYGVPVVGASGAIFGLLIAFGMLYPNMELMILFIPVPVKAKYIIPVYVVIELFLGVGQFGGDNVAHFAHIGGAIVGFIIVKTWGLKRPNTFG
jgi:membrane associated rhomboid family serine protease